MAVIHELARLTPRRREAGAIDGVVQTPFEKREQGHARYAFELTRPFKVISKLSFENKVDALDLLLLAKLLAVTSQRFAAPH